MTNEPSARRRRYNTFADKIGLVPNLRRRDNLRQGIAVAVFALLGATIGWAFRGSGGALLGVILGLLAGGFLSGFVLMILGLVRRE